ncbi:MAG: class I SAM-dependent methyltransferase [Clostridia bacterium]
MKIKLDRRLNAILGHINVGERVCDIGTDHGKLAVLAVGKTGEMVVASDISPNSIVKAKRLANENGCADKMDFRVGDGLEVIASNEVDTVVIAGIGGREIIDILSKSKSVFSKYILVPHQHTIELRRYLISTGFKIQRDYMLKSDTRFYQIFVVSGYETENREYSDFEMMFGLERNDDFISYKNVRLNKLRGLLKTASVERLSKIQNEISLLEENL